MTLPSRLAGHALGEELDGGAAGRRFRSTLGRRDVIVDVTPVRCDDELFERSIRRIEVMAALRHPHLVPIVDVGFDRDHLVVVTPAPDATPVDVGRPPADALAVIGAAASGLDHLHRAGVIHRDVQLVHVARYDGTVRLGGLGLCDRRGDETRGVGPIGAVSTMAPSIVRGRSATYGSDVYSLGASLHLLATGRAVHPVVVESLASRICRIGSTDPIVDPAIDPLVGDLVVAALAVDGDDRAEVVRPVLERLMAAAADESFATSTPSTSTPTRVTGGAP